MHQPRDEAENRTAGHGQSKLLADVIRVGLLAVPVAGAKRLRQLRTEPGIPAFVDAVQYARQLVRVGGGAEQTVERAAEFLRRDLPGIGRADGGEVRSVDEAALEKRQFVVKFDAIDMEGTLRRADPPQRLLGEYPLIGEIMDGQNGWDPRTLPGEVGRRECGLPVVGVNQIRCPILVQGACGKFGCSGGKSAETNVVVGPVAAKFITVGGAP